jgi:hypothetical protein
MRDSRPLFGLVLAATCLWCGACGSRAKSEAASVTGGDSTRGMAAISKYGCDRAIQSLESPELMVWWGRRWPEPARAFT